MLVMRRRAGESFMIGDGIEVEVLEVTGSRVKLGITAPASVEIVRKEAHLTRAENLSAAQPVNHSVIDALLTRLPGTPSQTDSQILDSGELTIPVFSTTSPGKKP